MKVRYRLLGDAIYPAALVASPSPMSRSETVDVLEIDAGVPLQVHPPGNGVEIVEVTAAEWQQLEAAGYTLRRAT